MWYRRDRMGFLARRTMLGSEGRWSEGRRCGVRWILNYWVADRVPEYPVPGELKYIAGFVLLVFVAAIAFFVYLGVTGAAP